MQNPLPLETVIINNADNIFELETYKQSKTGNNEARDSNTSVAAIGVNH